MIFSNQSGIKHGDSYVNQHLLISHKYLFYYDYTVDKVSHNDVIFKLDQNDIPGNLSKILDGKSKEN